jgi:hypothetical protein
VIRQRQFRRFLPPAAGHLPGGKAIPLLLGLAMVFGLSCDEALPPRDRPPVVLAGEVNIVNAAKPIVIRDGVPMGTLGAIEIRVTNIYDDVLQDSSILEGRVEIWMKARPEVRAEILLTESDLVTYRLMNGKILTIGVDTTLVMLRQWTHRSVEGIPIWEYVDLDPGMTPGGMPYCISDPITFVIRCSLRVFKSYGQIQIDDKEVQLTYEVFSIQC